MVTKNMKCFTFAMLPLFLLLQLTFVNGKKVDKALMEEVKKTLGNLRNDFEECIMKSMVVGKKTGDKDTSSKDKEEKKDTENDSEEKKDSENDSDKKKDSENDAEDKEEPDCPVPKEENEDWCCVEPVNTHTMCKFTETSADCKEHIIWIGLSMVGKRTLVDKHNELRNYLANGEETANLGEGNQPKAANMKKVVWSEDLATVAQMWVDQCSFDHDFNRNNKDGGKVGQNAFQGGKYSWLPARRKRSQQEALEKDLEVMGEEYELEDEEERKQNVSNHQMEMIEENIEMKNKRFKRSNMEVELTEEGRTREESGLGEAVQSWYSEVSNPGFDSKNIDPFVFDAGTGHYTQVAWADTEMVGCGWVFYKTYVEDGVQFYNTLVICNYFPSANYIGQAMYLVGEPGSKCPEGYSPSSQYAALCDKTG